MSIQTKAEAVAFVSMALQLQISVSLLSETFQDAMDLSRRFDISAQDVLQYRKESLTRKA